MTRELTAPEKEQAEAEHAECRRRWDKIRQMDPLRNMTLHSIEAHFPPEKVHDWRKNAPNS